MYQHGITTLCSDPRAYDDDGEIIDITDDLPYFLNEPYRPYKTGQPLCEGQVVGFNCSDGSCYDSLSDNLYVQLQVDCENDGVFDYVYNEIDYPDGFPMINCLYDESSRPYNGSYDINTSTWTYNASFVLFVPELDIDWTYVYSVGWRAAVSTQTLGLISPLTIDWMGFEDLNDDSYYGKNLVRILSVDVSDNVTVCTTAGEIVSDEAIYSSLNGIAKWVYDFGAIFHLSMSMTGYLIMMIVSGSLFFIGAYHDIKDTGILAAITFGILNIVFVISKIFSAVSLVVITVIALGMIAIRIYTPSTSTGGM